MYENLENQETEILYPFSHKIIFAMVMHDEARCRTLLERIFPGRKIAQIKISEKNKYGEEISKDKAEAEKVILNGPFHKSVQLDVLFEGDDTWYDIEFQVENKGNLAKRTRYYHSLIDAHILTVGKDYESLRPCYVIFLCKFDLFGKGEAVYQFENYDRKNDLPMNDEAYTIILNSTCEKERVPEELKNLFEYIEKGKLTSGKDPFIDEIHQKVMELNRRKELIHVMTLQDEWELQVKWARRDGLKEGKEAGLKEGKEVGMKEGKEEGKLEVARKMKAAGLDDAQIKAFTDLSEEEIKKL